MNNPIAKIASLTIASLACMPAYGGAGFARIQAIAPRSRIGEVAEAVLELPSFSSEFDATRVTPCSGRCDVRIEAPLQSINHQRGTVTALDAEIDATTAEIDATAFSTRCGSESRSRSSSAGTRRGTLFP